MMVSQRKRGKWSRFKSCALRYFGRKRNYIVTTRDRIPNINAKDSEAPISESTKVHRYYRCKKSRPPHDLRCRPKDAFEKALAEENLYASTGDSASMPVLNICLGFSNAEIRDGRMAQYSVRINCWQQSRLPIFQRVTCDCGNLKHNPQSIVATIPATAWLKSVEPSLPILVALHKIKHRRSNLSLRRKCSPVNNGSDHDGGDFSFEHWPLMIGPPARHEGNIFPLAPPLPQNGDVRIHPVMDFVEQPIGIDIMRMLQALNRLQHRRRRDLGIDLSFLDQFVNVNQSANPSYEVAATPTIKLGKSKSQFSSTSTICKNNLTARKICAEHRYDITLRSSFQDMPISLCYANIGLRVTEFTSENNNNSSDDSPNGVPDFWSFNDRFKKWYLCKHPKPSLSNQTHTFDEYLETLNSGNPCSVLAKGTILQLATNCVSRRLFLQKFNGYLDAVDDSEKAHETILHLGCNIIKLENKDENSVLRTVWMKKINASDFNESIFIRSHPPGPSRRKRETSHEYTKSEMKHQPIPDQSQEKDNVLRVSENDENLCLIAGPTPLNIGLASSDDADNHKGTPRSPNIAICSLTTHQTSLNPVDLSPGSNVNTDTSECDLGPRLENQSDLFANFVSPSNNLGEGDQSNNSSTDNRWLQCDTERTPRYCTVQYKLQLVTVYCACEHQSNQVFFILVSQHVYIPLNNIIVSVYKLDRNLNSCFASNQNSDISTAEKQDVLSGSHDGVANIRTIFGFLKSTKSAGEKSDNTDSTPVQRIFAFQYAEPFLRWFKLHSSENYSYSTMAPKYYKQV